MSPKHSDWPMKAMVQKKNESGEWEDYGQIAGVNYAEVWIAKREDPSQWRVIEILVPEEEEDGTSGQDRESYSDDQDRESYTVSEEEESE